MALSAGVGNVAIAVGNPGPNRGMQIAEGYRIPPSESQPSWSQAIGTFNTSILVGNGSNAISLGGRTSTSPRVLPTIGHNTAVSFGNGSNSYAGTLPPAYPPNTTNNPNHQFAGALGNFKRAINGVNNK